MKSPQTPVQVEGLTPEQVYQVLTTFHNTYVDNILDWFQEFEPDAYDRYLDHIRREGVEVA